MHRLFANGTAELRERKHRVRALFGGKNFWRRRAEKKTHTPVDVPRMIDRIAQHAAAATGVAGDSPPAMYLRHAVASVKNGVSLQLIVSFPGVLVRDDSCESEKRAKGTMYDVVVVATRRRCVATDAAWRAASLQGRIESFSNPGGWSIREVGWWEKLRKILFNWLGSSLISRCHFALCRVASLNWILIILYDFLDVPRIKNHSSYDPERRWRVRRQRVRESHQWWTSRVDKEGTSARD